MNTGDARADAAARAVCREVSACGLHADRSIDRRGCICMVYARAALVAATRIDMGLESLEGAK